jgi:hypothetical protein
LKDKLAIELIMSSVGALLGTVFVLFLFVSVYQTQVNAEVIRGASIEAVLVSLVLPALTNLAIVGGVLWITSGYGFATGGEWAFPTAITACVLSILAGFFPILPWVSSNLGFPPTSIVFAVNLLFFVLLQTYVRPTERKVLLLSLLAGVAYVLAFINGVAGTHYLMATNAPIFVAVQPLNFIASFSWGVTTISVTLGKWWARPLAIGSAAASSLGGIPIALITQIELRRPSLFWPSPLAALAILLFIYLTRARGGESTVEPPAATG